jgi:hypothetical protein
MSMVVVAPNACTFTIAVKGADRIGIRLRAPIRRVEALDADPSITFPAVLNGDARLPTHPRISTLNVILKLRNIPERHPLKAPLHLPVLRHQPSIAR